MKFIQSIIDGCQIIEADIIMITEENFVRVLVKKFFLLIT